MKVWVIFEDQRSWGDKALAAKQKLLDEYGEMGPEFDIEEWEVK